MIRIGKPRIEECANGNSRLVATISTADSVKDLWIEVPCLYRKYICDDRSDAFVIGLLYYAMSRKEDIVCDAPVTDELRTQIEEDFIDVICRHEHGAVYKTRLICETISPIKKSERVLGCGCSCGVDSLYTIKRRLFQNEKERRYLVLTNMHGAVEGDTASSALRRWIELKRHAQMFADSINIPLITIDSNYDQRCLPGLLYDNSTTYGNLFCVYALQKLFSHYYVAADGEISVFGEYLKRGFGCDCAWYDLLSCSAWSVSGFHIIADGFTQRTEKVRVLCDWPLAWRFLDVCHVHGPKSKKRNGTNDCAKCMRTILEIMACGENLLPRFAEVFDVDFVVSHKYQFLAELIRIKLHRTVYAEELWPHIRDMGFSFADWIAALRIVLKKTFRKAIHWGVTNRDFLPEG